jgi:Copine
VHGVAGVLNAYREVFKSGLIMSGPTEFREVIQTAAARAISSQEAAQRKGQQAYTILLILTDGAVSDVQGTADCLNSVSGAPMSVVIVGVGNADFSAMQFLDDSAKPGKRDIAQFVQFNKHRQSSVTLTSETLKEIPDQLVGYFQSAGIAPLPPVKRSDSEIVVEPEEEEIDLALNINDEEIVVTGGGNDFVDGFGASR